MQPSSGSISARPGAQRRRAQARLRRCTVLLIAASAQLLATGSPGLGRAAPTPRRARSRSTSAARSSSPARAGGPAAARPWSRTFAPASPGSDVVVRAVGARTAAGAWSAAGPGPRRRRDRSPCAGASTAAHRRGRAHLVVAPRAGAPMGAALRGHLLRHAARHVGVERPGARARGGLAPRTCARVDPGARSVGGGVLHLGVAPDPARAGQPCDYDWKGTARPQPLPPHDPGRHRAHATSSSTASSPPGSSRSAPTDALGVLDAPQGTPFVDGDPAAGTEIDVMEFFGDTGRGAETIGSFVT